MKPKEARKLLKRFYELESYSPEQEAFFKQYIFPEIVKDLEGEHPSKFLRQMIKIMVERRR